MEGATSGGADQDTVLASSEAILEFLNEAEASDRYDHEVSHQPTGQGVDVLLRRYKTGEPAGARECYRPDLRKLEDAGQVRRRGNQLSITPEGKRVVTQPRG